MTRKQRSYAFTVLLLGVTLYTVWPKKSQPNVPVAEIQGTTMGSIGYNVKVVGTDENLKPSIDSILIAFNESLSTYIADSEISRFNKESHFDQNELSAIMADVVNKSYQVWEATRGAFDPTVGPLINAWGFGPDKKIIEPDSATIDSLLLLIGMDKVEMNFDGLNKKENVTLDFSAIAKGQAVDQVSVWLESKGFNNHMVEIGGEVRARGKSPSDTTWMIGVQDPRVELTDKRLAIVSLDNQSMATSGNYRNYYEQDGILRAHIVDPITGYTADHNLLSATVIADDCMTADAYATAFMVMGLDRSIEMVELKPNLEALFVFQSGDEFDIYVSSGISENTILEIE